MYDIALLSMQKKVFRTREAIKSFDTCLKCPDLPKEKVQGLKKEILLARTLAKEQDAEVCFMFLCFACRYSRSHIMSYNTTNHTLFYHRRVQLISRNAHHLKDVLYFDLCSRTLLYIHP